MTYIFEVRTTNGVHKAWLAADEAGDEALELKCANPEQRVWIEVIAEEDGPDETGEVESIGVESCSPSPHDCNP